MRVLKPSVMEVLYIRSYERFSTSQDNNPVLFKKKNFQQMDNLSSNFLSLYEFFGK